MIGTSPLISEFFSWGKGDKMMYTFFSQGVAKVNKTIFFSLIMQIAG